MKNIPFEPDEYSISESECIIDNNDYDSAYEDDDGYEII